MAKGSKVKGVNEQKPSGSSKSKVEEDSEFQRFLKEDEEENVIVAKTTKNKDGFGFGSYKSACNFLTRIERDAKKITNLKEREIYLLEKKLIHFTGLLAKLKKMVFALKIKPVQKQSQEFS